MKAEDILRRAGRLLSDHTNVRWTESEILDYVNDAQAQIALLRPDANSRNEKFQLDAGSKQVLNQEGAIALLRVTRNMGPDGNTPGRVIYPTIRSALDAETPDWHTKTGSVVQHYIYDPDTDRKTFYVYPSADGWIEIVYSATPALAESMAEVLDLSDQYRNAVVDWVLYRCFSKDAEYSGNQQLAAKYYQDFYQAIGVKTEVDKGSNPTRRVRGAEIELR